MKRQEKIEQIILAVAAEFQVNPTNLVAADGVNTLRVIHARQVCAVLLREMMLSSDIGSLLGKRGHQYVGGAVSAVTKKAQKDNDFLKRLLKLSERFAVKLPMFP